MEYSTIQECTESFEELTNEYKDLEALNKEYMQKLEEVTELQEKCVKQIAHQRYRLSVLSKSFKKLPSDEGVEKLRGSVWKRKELLQDMEQSLPKANGRYLKIILGNVNVSILNKNDKFRYKDEYEKFKLVLSIIGFVLSVLNLLVHSRSLELIFMFLLVWYYCTLTIRESILKMLVMAWFVSLAIGPPRLSSFREFLWRSNEVNGSRIKGWWRVHHFASTVCAGVLLIWPNSATWHTFRPQFMMFNVYISVVQALQFWYQQGVLYRLKALGERHNMDITIEGFHSWMWRGLSFLLPFLYAGYMFQLFNAYKLYQLSFHKDAVWQIPVLSLLFFVLFLGNIITTSYVIPEKLRERRRKRENERLARTKSSDSLMKQE